MLIMSSPPPPRSTIGLCVIGQARGFALPAVRGNLRIFVDQLASQHGNSSAIVHFAVARLTPPRPALPYKPAQPRSRMDASLAQLATEFPEASFDITEASTCDAAPASSTTCCIAAFPNSSVASSSSSSSTSSVSRAAVSHAAAAHAAATRWQPGAWLQYYGVSRCALRLFERVTDQQRTLSHLIRTRPDVLYLDAVATARQIGRTPMAVMQTRGGLRHTSGREPCDWFFVAPSAQALPFFQSFATPYDRSCAFDPHEAQPQHSRCLHHRNCAFAPQPEDLWRDCAAHARLCPEALRPPSRIHYGIADFRIILIESTGIARCGGIVGGNVRKCTNESERALEAGRRRLQLVQHTTALVELEALREGLR